MNISRGYTKIARLPVQNPFGSWSDLGTWQFYDISGNVRMKFGNKRSNTHCDFLWKILIFFLTLSETPIM